MPRFQVDLQWLEAGYLEIEAETEQEAVQVARAAPLPHVHWPAVQRPEPARNSTGWAARHSELNRSIRALADFARSLITIRLYGGWYSIFVSGLLLLIGASFLVDVIGERHLNQWTIWATGAATAVELARLMLWRCGLRVGRLASAVHEGPTVSASGATIQQIHRLADERA